MADATDAPEPWSDPVEEQLTPAAEDDADPVPLPCPPLSSSSDGPLRSLADKAASNNLLRRARDTVPSFVEPAVTRTERVSGKVISHVDASLVAAQRTLDTEEGRQLLNSAQAFWSSVLVFVCMLWGQGLNKAENQLGMEAREGAEGVERAKGVVGVATRKVRERLQRREKEAGNGVEAEVYAKGRVLMGIGVAVMTCIAVALAKYRGPANEWVVPVAERALRVLPTDKDSHSESVQEGEQLVEELPVEADDGGDEEVEVNEDMSPEED